MFWFLDAQCICNINTFRQPYFQPHQPLKHILFIDSLFLSKCRNPTFTRTRYLKFCVNPKTNKKDSKNELFLFPYCSMSAISIQDTILCNQNWFQNWRIKNMNKSGWAGPHSCSKFSKFQLDSEYSTVN